MLHNFGGNLYLTNSIGQSSGLLNRRFGVQVPGGVPLLASPANCQKRDIVVNLLASGLGAALARLLMLGVLYRTPRGALRKAACRTGGLEEMTITSFYLIYHVVY